MNETQIKIAGKIAELVKSELDCQTMLIVDCDRNVKKMEDSINDIQIKRAFYHMKKASLQKILDAMNSVEEREERSDLTVDVEGIEN